jgi:hypothetical protein
MTMASDEEAAEDRWMDKWRSTDLERGGGGGRKEREKKNNKKRTTGIV